MKSLIEKLEAAEAGSRELDAAIWCALKGVKFKDVFDFSNNVCFTRPPKRREEVSKSGSLLNYTTSLDAALPGENIIHVSKYGEAWKAMHQETDDTVYHGEAHTEALARRIAAIKARDDDR